MIRSKSSSLLNYIFIATIALATVWISFACIHPWNIDKSNDVDAYYYDAVHPFTQTQFSPIESLLGPFFGPPIGRHLNPADPKPVFLSNLNIFISLLKIVKPNIAWPGRTAYISFVFFSLFLLLIAAGLLSKAVGSSRSGPLATCWVMLSPWAFIYLYYPAYLQLSLAFFLMSLLCLLYSPSVKNNFAPAEDDKALSSLRSTLRMSIVSGLFASLALLSNPGLLYYCLSIYAMLLLRPFLYKKTSRSQDIFCFTLGFVLPFILIEFARLSGLAEWLLKRPVDSSSLTILLGYYQHSLKNNHFILRDMNTFPRIPFFFFRILKHQSLAETLTAVVLLLSLFSYFMVSLFKNLEKISDLRCRASSFFIKLGKPSLLLVPCLLPLILMDLLPTVQLGRLYFPSYLLLILISFYLLPKLLPRKLFFLPILLMITLFPARALSLRAQHIAFHGFNQAITALPSARPNLAFLNFDPHREILLHLLDRSDYGVSLPILAPSQLDKASEHMENLYFVQGPQTETIIQNKPFPRGFPIWKPGLAAVHAKKQLLLGEPQRVPFYGLYPLLIFEDEFDSYRYFSEKAFSADSFKESLGEVLIWPLVTGNLDLGQELTPLVDNISVSNADPGFGALKLFDDSLLEDDAWQITLKEPAEVWINIQFKQPVRLSHIAMQAPFGFSGNMDWTPHKILLMAGDHPALVTHMVALEPQFSGPGMWSLMPLQEELPFSAYRIRILESGANSKRVRIQELKLFGKVVTGS